MDARPRSTDPDRGPLSRDRDLWIVAGITAAAALIRFATLGHQSYDHDETVTVVRVIWPSLTQTLHGVAHTERTPPLYYVLAWLWSKLFGTGEVGLRSLSVLFGTLTVPAAYLAARELVSRCAGLIAAALVAVNPALLWYSQEARAFALYVLFSAWALYFFARALRDRTPRSLALWALTSALALCSYYFAVFLVIPEALWLIYSIRPRRPAIAASAVPTIAGLALVPLAHAQVHAGHVDLFRSEPLVARAGRALLEFVASVEPQPLAGNSAVDAVQIIAGLGAAVVFITAIVIVARRGQSSERFAAASVGAVAGVSFGLPVLVAAAGFDFIEPRKVLIGSVVPLLVLVAVALGVRRAGKLGLAGAAAGVMIFVGVSAAAYVSRQMQRPNWQAAAHAIGPAHESRVIVVMANGQAPLAYYLHARTFGPHNLHPAIRVAEIYTLAKKHPISPPPGFRQVDLRYVAGFWLRRFQAPGPRRITPMSVGGNRVLPQRALILFQRVPTSTNVAPRG